MGEEVARRSWDGRRRGVGEKGSRKRSVSELGREGRRGRGWVIKWE